MDAYAKSKTPKEARDKRGTPPGLTEFLGNVFGLEFVVDVCAEPLTNQGSRSYWTEEDDALNQDWAKTYRWHSPYAIKLPAFWMNPPYSNPSAWCEKAVREARKGAVIVGLLPDDRSTQWYRDFVKEAAAEAYVTDIRLPFLDQHGIPQYGNPKGSIIPIWTPWAVADSEPNFIEKTIYIPDSLKARWRKMR